MTSASPPPPPLVPDAANAPQPGDAAQATENRQIQIHLRKIPMLAGLSDEELIPVKAELRIRHYAKRQVVLQKGGSGDGLLLLLSGQLQVIDVTEDGRAIGLRMLQP